MGGCGKRFSALSTVMDCFSVGSRMPVDKLSGRVSLGDQAWNLGVGSKKRPSSSLDRE